MKKEILIMGIDQGYANLGIAILGYQQETKNISIKETKTIKTYPTDEMSVRLKKIYNELKQITKEYKIKYAACERLFHNKTQSNGRNKSANIMYTNMSTGVVYLICGQKNIKMKDYAPTSVKKTLTNNGRATKEELEIALNELMKKFDIEVHSNHESDAIAIAITLIERELK